jgi:hypothetical protein
MIIRQPKVFLSKKYIGTNISGKNIFSSIQNRALENSYLNKPAFVKSAESESENKKIGTYNAEEVKKRLHQLLKNNS